MSKGEDESSLSSRLFLELYDAVEEKVKAHETVCSLVRTANGGTWHGNEWDLGWNSGVQIVLDELEKRGLLKDG